MKLQLITPSFILIETPENVVFLITHKGNYKPIAINGSYEDITTDNKIIVCKWEEINNIFKFGNIEFNNRKYLTAGGFQRKFIEIYYTRLTH